MLNRGLEFNIYAEKNHRNIKSLKFDHWFKRSTVHYEFPSLFVDDDKPALKFFETNSWYNRVLYNLLFKKESCYNFAEKELLSLVSSTNRFIKCSLYYIRYYFNK